MWEKAGTGANSSSSATPVQSSKSILGNSTGDKAKFTRAGETLSSPPATQITLSPCVIMLVNLSTMLLGVRNREIVGAWRRPFWSVSNWFLSHSSFKRSTVSQRSDYYTWGKSQGNANGVSPESKIDCGETAFWKDFRLHGDFHLNLLFDMLLRHVWFTSVESCENENIRIFSNCLGTFDRNIRVMANIIIRNSLYWIFFMYAWTLKISR